MALVKIIPSLDVTARFAVIGHKKTFFVGSLITILLVIAAFARYSEVGWDYSHRDEAFSWRLIQYSLPELLSRAAEDVHPPLYYLLLKAWTSAFGLSMLSLRTLSVLFGVATVPLLWLTVQEACSYLKDSKEASQKSNFYGPFLSAGLVAFHAGQIHPGRDARMYSLGVFLAVLTSWLLLKALNSSKPSMKWWIFYGIAVAAFCYTHNYAFFTVFSQALYMLSDIAYRAIRESRERAWRIMQDYLLAILIAVTLFCPWIPDLHHQIQEVRVSYWIPGVTWEKTTSVLAAWGGGAATVSWEGGSDYITKTEVKVWLVVLSGLTVFTFWKRNRAMWFFFLQACVPWILALGLSIYGDRPIFMERYMIFSQVALFGLWGVVFESIGSIFLRALIFWFLVMTVAYNGVASLSQLPGSPPPAVAAMKFVKEEYKEGDVIIADWVRTVNQLRYYANDVRLSPVNIKVVLNQFRPSGHQVHFASLSEDDIIWSDKWPSNKYNRIWQVQDIRVPGTVDIPKGIELIERRDFKNEEYIGPESIDYTVRLYGKKE